MSGADNTASARPAQEQNIPDFHNFRLRAVGAPEAYAYVRAYGVPAEYGRRVVVDGKPGIIVKDCGYQLGVCFDARPANDIARCHPTWRVEYGEVGTPRKVTRSQQRYLDYLDADSGGTFAEYLCELSRRARETAKSGSEGRS
jgi:hypothetical protein